MKKVAWTVRHDITGKRLGTIEDSDIDRALALTRTFFGHSVTVDNLEPTERDL